jgi:hypothetical protein
MKTGERALTLGAVVMALCCAAPPIAAAILGAGALTGTGVVSAVGAGILCVAVIGAMVWRRRRGGRC